MLCITHTTKSCLFSDSYLEFRHGDMMGMGALSILYENKTGQFTMCAWGKPSLTLTPEKALL